MDNPYDPASSVDILKTDDASCASDDGDCECSRSICSWKIAAGVIVGLLLTLNVAFASMPSLAQQVASFIPESILPSGAAVIGGEGCCSCPHSMDSLDKMDLRDEADQLVLMDQ